MQWLRISLLLVLVAILFTGCAGIKDFEGSDNYNSSEDFQKGSVTTYFYHYESCNYCGIVKPYVEHISSEMGSDSLKFEFCDVKKPETCSPASISLKEKIGLKVVPAVVVVANNTPQKFIGWKEVCDLGAYYKILDLELPVMNCHGKDYSVQECVDCHRENDLHPPSKFDCSCPDLN